MFQFHLDNDKAGFCGEDKCVVTVVENVEGNAFSVKKQVKNMVKNVLASFRSKKTKSEYSPTADSILTNSTLLKQLPTSENAAPCTISFSDLLSKETSHSLSGKQRVFDAQGNQSVKQTICVVNATNAIVLVEKVGSTSTIFNKKNVEQMLADLSDKSSAVDE